MTKEIPLTKGLIALVDDEDFDRINEHKWFSNNGYGARHVRQEPYGQKCIYMHREVLNVPDDVEIDHINLVRSDNRKQNLRTATSLQNKRNKRPEKSGTSGYKGVSLNKRAGKWIAYIMVNYHQIHLGYFDTPEEAAHAYDAAAKKRFGEFAWLNFPEEGQS